MSILSKHIEDPRSISGDPEWDKHYHPLSDGKLDHPPQFRVGDSVIIKFSMEMLEREWTSIPSPISDHNKTGIITYVGVYKSYFYFYLILLKDGEIHYHPEFHVFPYRTKKEKEKILNTWYNMSDEVVS